MVMAPPLVKINMPVYFDNIRGDMEVDGYEELGFGWDGWTNKVRIQPVRIREDGSAEPVGQDYTIGCSHLARIVTEARKREGDRRGKPEHVICS